MDRVKADRIRNKLDEVLALVADDLKEELGVTVALRNGSYNSANITFKLECAEINADGVAQTKEVSDFRRYAYRLGLDPKDLGREFRAGGQLFEICGLKPRSRRYPILGKNKAGKVYKFAASTVKFGLEIRGASLSKLP